MMTHRSTNFKELNLDHEFNKREGTSNINNEEILHFKPPFGYMITESGIEPPNLMI